MKNIRYLESLEEQFKENADPAMAKGQEAYMRNQFPFLGLKTTKRRELQKPFLKKGELPPKEELEGLINYLWEKPEREYQYFAQELFFRYKKGFQVSDISLLEYMLRNRSWWETVDFIASNLAGEYFQKFPEQRKVYVEK